MVSTAGTRLKLNTNGTFLSELYPRPATADAWKAVPLQHPAVARREVPKPDPDCLNLGCQIETNASWVRSSLSDQERHNHHRHHDSGLASIVTLVPSLIPDAVLNMSSSVIQSTTDWLSAAGRAALSFGGLGAAANNSSSSMLLGSSSLSLAPASGVAADLVGSLRQVVTVANSLLATLTGGLPAAQPVPAGGVLASTSSTNVVAGPAPAAVAAVAAAAAAKPPVAAEKAKASK